MRKRILNLLLVMTMGMALLVGCGNSEEDTTVGGDEVKVSQNAEGNQENNAGADDAVNVSQNTEEKQDNQEVATAVITDVFTEKKIEVSYNTAYCEAQDNGEYLLSVYVEDGEMFDIEFFADYTSESYYQEQVSAFASMGLEASALENYTSDGATVYGFEFYDKVNNAMYSHQLLLDVDGGLLIVHNPNLDSSNEENAKAFVEKVFVSAEMDTDEIAATEGSSNSEESTEQENKLAITKEEKEAVYKADYEAIKDRIVKEEADGSEVSYYDANGFELMCIYGTDISDVFFYKYYDSGERQYSKVYTFDESGEYSILEFEFHENGNKKTETYYEDNGNKTVVFFDEEEKYISATAYDKDGNVIN